MRLASECGVGVSCGVDGKWVWCVSELVMRLASECGVGVSW